MSAHQVNQRFMGTFNRLADTSMTYDVFIGNEMLANGASHC